MNTTINTLIISRLTFVCVCVCVCVCTRTYGVKTLKIYSLNKFQLYNAVLLTLVIKLHNRSPKLIHFMTEHLYAFDYKFFIFNLSIINKIQKLKINNIVKT